MQGSIFTPSPVPRQLAKAEIKAGRMVLEGGKVKPDPRKGKISITDGGPDGLTHFQWTDLASGSVVDDYIVFAGDARLVKAVQSKGRVYLLEFSGEHVFFWLQETEPEKDEERIRLINDAINSVRHVSFDQQPRPGKTGKSGKGGKSKIHSANTNEELAAILKSFARARPREECNLHTVPSLSDILTSEVLEEVANDPQVSSSLAQ